ncbi:MAG: helix-turn-helix transcriptional regulator [Euryarchaeota archaeon]|nr:helix-turn-helix transcriptional regulator [Euryarchaeota archaeon]
MEELYRMKADLVKALAHPTRLRILDLLRNGERCVCEIYPALELEQPNISQHLALLRERGIVAWRKEGISIYYKVKDPRVFDALDLLEGVFARELDETQKLLVELRR